MAYTLKRKEYWAALLEISGGHETVWGLSAGVVFPISLLVCFAIAIFAWKTWRCPNCNKSLGQAWPAKCPGCHADLR